MEEMMMAMTFQEVREQYLPVLKKYVPVVDRVHGASHPEFHDVKAVFDEMVVKMEDAQSTPALKEDFQKLQEITSNYAVPSDTCETYEAVYRMLKEADLAYHSEA